MSQVKPFSVAILAGLFGFLVALLLVVDVEPRLARAGSADNYFLNGADAMRFSVTMASAPSADSTEGWANNAMYDENSAAWARHSLAATRGGGSTVLGTPGQQTISTVCAQVPSAGRVSTRTGISLQVIGGSITVRCSFNSDCTNPQFSIDPGQLLALSFSSAIYCNTTSSTATLGQAEYK